MEALSCEVYGRRYEFDETMRYPITQFKVFTQFATNSLHLAQTSKTAYRIVGNWMSVYDNFDLADFDTSVLSFILRKAHEMDIRILTPSPDRALASSELWRDIRALLADARDHGTVMKEQAKILEQTKEESAQALQVYESMMDGILSGDWGSWDSLNEDEREVRRAKQRKAHHESYIWKAMHEEANARHKEIEIASLTNLATQALALKISTPRPWLAF